MNWHRLKPGRSSDFMKNFSNLACSTTLSVLSDYLSVALALFLRQYTLWWRYGVTLWLLWLECRRCAFQPLDPTQNPVVPKGPWVFFLSLKAICWFQVYLLPLAVFSPVHRHSAQGELSSGGGESVCKRQCTAQEPNDRRCGVCGRRSTENVFVRLLFSGKNCRAQFINSAVTWCAHGMSQLGRK